MSIRKTKQLGDRPFPFVSSAVLLVEPLFHFSVGCLPQMLMTRSEPSIEHSAFGNLSPAERR